MFLLNLETTLGIRWTKPKLLYTVNQLTDHHAAGLLAEVAPVAVDERLLQLRGRDLSRLVLVDGVEPLLHVGIHLRSGRGTVATGRGAAGIASGRGTPRRGTGTTITLEFGR